MKKCVLGPVLLISFLFSANVFAGRVIGTIRQLGDIFDYGINAYESYQVMIDEGDVIANLVRLFGEERLSPDERGSDRQTPLHVAVELDAPLIVDFLLERGAGVTLLNGQGVTALQLAHQRFDGEIIGIFERHGHVLPMPPAPPPSPEVPPPQRWEGRRNPLQLTLGDFLTPQQRLFVFGSGSQ